jgi:flagellar biosynthetic protein FliR
MYSALGITPAELQQYLLILSRVASLLFTMPVFSSNMLDGRLRAFLAFFLALLCAPILPVPADLPVDILYLGFLVGKEVLVGLIIGLIASYLFEGIRVTGNLVSEMSNLSMAQLLDPSTDEENQVIGEIQYTIALLILFSVNGHHFFIQAIFDSFRIVPLTNASFSLPLLPMMIHMTGDIFVVGIKLAAPILCALFLEKVLLAMLAKVSPDLDIIFVAMPIGILVGIYFIMISWPYFSYAFLKLFGFYQRDVLEFIRGLTGS